MHQLLPLSRIEGCLLGHALGDAVGAKREGDVAARSVWWTLGLTRPRVLRYTDDTLMTLGLVRSLVKCGEINQDDLAKTWARDARWSRGYGPAALKTLRRIAKGTDWRDASRSIYPQGSYGNGAAMRVAPLGLLLASEDDRRSAARKSAEITHAHPLGIEGAVLLAEAVHLAANGLDGDVACAVDKLTATCASDEFKERLSQVPALLDSLPEFKSIANTLGNRMTAHESVVTAVYCYFRFRDAAFDNMLTFILKMGGDTDTIAAMAGALFGARRGRVALSEDLIARLEAGGDVLQAARVFDQLSRARFNSARREHTTDADTVQGRFYVLEYMCTCCEACTVEAPEFLANTKEGHAIVIRQPETPEQVERMHEAMDQCPTEAVIDRDNPNE